MGSLALVSAHSGTQAIALFNPGVEREARTVSALTATGAR
jgi:hypothetical protein